MTKATEAEVWADLYHPVEHKILAKYLDWDPLVPVDDVGIYDGAGEDTGHICVEEDAWGEDVEFAPDWYRDRVDRGDEGKSRTVRDKKRRGQFIRLINDDVPFQDMPDDVRRLFLQPW